MPRNEVARAIIVLTVVLVLWAAYLILFQSVARTRGLQADRLGVITRSVLFALFFTVAAYRQRRHEPGFSLKFRTQIAWQAVFGGLLWAFLQATAQYYWYRTLTWTPVLGGIVWLATTVVAGSLLLIATRRQTDHRRER